MHLNPYVTFDGTCRAAAEFYATVFKSEIAELMTFGEMPDGGAPDPSLSELIAHARVPIGDRQLMMSDTGPWSKHEGFHGMTLQLSMDTPEEAAALFAALSDGGEVSMPLEKTFWARAFGMCRDQFGVAWMVNCD
ncbi:MAG: VOC family protein [Pseudomonadota bacterium]